MSNQPPAPPPTPPAPPSPSPVDYLQQRPVRSSAFWIVVVGLIVIWLIAWATDQGRWIHLLPVLALVTALFERFGRKSRNIEAGAQSTPVWDPKRPDDSLAEIHIYVLEQAAKSTDWYWKRKGAKAWWSQVIRFAVWVLATIGGLLPILAVVLGPYFAQLPLTKDSHLKLSNGLWASLFLGLAAALLGLDKGFGFSSGWARYVLTATNIRKGLEEFRLDWTALRAKAGVPLTAEKAAPLIDRAKQFRSEVEGLVLQETKDWVTEFQSTMAQMEKDVAAQLSTLKSQVDKSLKEREAVSQPGYVQVVIKDPAAKFAPGSLSVSLIDSANLPVQSVHQQPLTSLTWVSPFVAPGLYQLRVEGTINGVLFSETRSATVQSGVGASPVAPEITL